MSKALIIYGSTTGKTEFTAETLESALSDKGYDVTLTNISDANINLLDEKYDPYLIGSSTWGDEKVAFQENFESFYEDMNGSLKYDFQKKP